MEASLQELKASPRMVPRAVYLPNCDRKGFYKRKQVRSCPMPPSSKANLYQGTSTSKRLKLLLLTMVFLEPHVLTTIVIFPTPCYIYYTNPHKF